MIHVFFILQVSSLQQIENRTYVFWVVFLHNYSEISFFSHETWFGSLENETRDETLTCHLISVDFYVFVYSLGVELK